MSVPSPISRHLVIAIAFLGVVLVFSLFRWQTASPGQLKDQDSHRETVVADEPQVVSSGPADPVRTKPRFRANHPKPTIEETIGLLRTTIIPVLDLPPDQPLPERIARINQLIREAGVESWRLRLITRIGDPALRMRFRDKMRIREIPVAETLKYMCDSTKLRYQIRENGIVEMTTLEDRDYAAPIAEPESSNDDPDARQENDPFAEPSADPFAEPATAR